LPLSKKLIGVDAHNTKHNFTIPNQMKPHSAGYKRL